MLIQAAETMAQFWVVPNKLDCKQKIQAHYN